jgi:hypothetical protein
MATIGYSGVWENETINHLLTIFPILEDALDDQASHFIASYQRPEATIVR